MAMIDDFKTRFPEFTDATVDQYWPILEPLWPCYFCGDYNDCCDREAILNLIAHLLVLETTPGSSAASSTSGVASKSVGNVSISYNTKTSTDSNVDFFGGTKYGQRFMMLVKGRMGGAWV